MPAHSREFLQVGIPVFFTPGRTLQKAWIPASVGMSGLMTAPSARRREADLRLQARLGVQKGDVGPMQPGYGRDQR